MKRLVIAMCLLVPAAAHAAPQVSVEAGNVVIGDGSTRNQLTKSGRDSEPVLSPDGRFVVFTRSGTKKADGMECASGADADALMRVNADGSSETVLVRGQASKKPEGQLCGFSAKQFNSDGRFVYFLTPGWVTSGALHVYDFTAKAEHFVVAASGLFVLSACKNEHKDRLAVVKHKYFVFGGSYDWYWLYDPVARQEIGPLGDIDEKELPKQAKLWCE